MHISKNCKRALKALTKMGCAIKGIKGGWRITPPRPRYVNSKGRTANEAYTMHPSDRHIGVMMDHIVRSWDFNLYAPHLRDLAKAYPPIQQKAKP